MKQASKNAWLTTSNGVLALIVIVVSINVISSRLYTRLDVTEDRIFTLTEGSEKIIDELKGKVEAKLFFSRSIKELPPIIKTYATRVEEVLQEYAGKSGGKLSVDVVDPRPDSDEEELARKYGMRGVPLPTQEQLYFGIVFLHLDTEIIIPYLDPRREEFLEYDISEALVQLFNKEKATVGVMSSLPVMGNPMTGGEAWMLVNFLQRNYEVKEVAANVEAIDPAVNVLLVLHPKELSDKTQYAIDQFVVGGGRVIVAVDPMSRFDLSQANAHSQMMGQPPKTSSDLAKLFRAWNIEYKPDEIIGDANYTTTVNAGGYGIAYPYFMSMTQDAFSSDVVITSQLNQMLLAEAGAIASKPDSPYSFEPWIETSQESGTGGAQMAAYMGPEGLANSFKPDGKQRTIAALLRGKFKTAFPGGFKEPPAEGEGQQESAAATNHKEEAENEGSIVIVTDTDFLYDGNAVSRMQFGGQVIARPINDNLTFLFNTIDYLAGSEALISIRSRGKISRPFTLVAKIQKEAQQKWKDKEEQLSKELQELQAKLNDMQAQRTDGNVFTLSSEQQKEIKRFRDEEARLMRERRIVRRNLREDIEALGHKLVAANMLVVPLLVSGFGFFMFSARNNRKNRGRRS